MSKYNAILLFFALLFASPAMLQAVEGSPLSSEAWACDLPAPGNFHVTGFTAHSVSLAWDNVPGASKYLVEAYETNSPTPFTWQIVTSTATTVQVPTPNTPYIFTVAAICPNNEVSANKSEVPGMSGIILDLVLEYSPHQQLQLVSPNQSPNCLVYNLPWLAGSSYWFFIKKNGQTAKYEIKIPFTDRIKITKRDGDPTFPYGLDGSIWRDPPRDEVDAVGVFTVPEPEPWQAPDIGLLSLAQPNNSTLEVDWCDYNSTYIFELYKPFYNQGPDKRADASEALADIQISPNPFTDLLQVSGLNPDSETTLQLFHFDGRLALSQQTTTAQNYYLNTQDLPAGVYFLRIESEGVQKTHKLVKIN